MHYLMWSDKVDELAFWKDYVKVNEIFAKKVIENYEEGDISKCLFFLKKKKVHCRLRVEYSLGSRLSFITCPTIDSTGLA
jgi:hypothetical protein